MTARIDIVRSVPHIEQYNGVWAMHAPAFEQTLAHLRALDLLTHVAQAGPGEGEKRGDRGYAVSQGVAIVECVGLMTKYGSSFSDSPGMLRLRQAVRRATADAEAAAILLMFDSPGGTANGTDDFADEVARAAAVKPVHAYIEDMGASAAYYVASQASRLTANPSAVVGSIGTYMVVQDWSKVYADAGVKVNVIRAGKFKGAGAMGAPVSDDELEMFQRFIDQTNEMFLAAVARGRGMSRQRVEELADGAVWIGRHAVEAGLLDAVETLDEAMDAARSAGRSQETSFDRLESRSPRAGGIDPKESSMTAEEFGKKNPEVVQAWKDEGRKAGLEEGRKLGLEAGLAAGVKSERERVAALKGAFGERPAFVVDQAMKGHDLAQAKGELADVLQVELADTQAKLTASRDAAAQRSAALEDGHGAALAVGHPDPAKKEDAPRTPEQRIRADWDANKDGCREKYSKNFYAYRAMRLDPAEMQMGERKSVN